MMADFVNTDAYAESTGAMLDAWLTTSGPLRKMMENKHDAGVGPTQSALA